jgi:glucose/arabinose dehydrogenase
VGSRVRRVAAAELGALLCFSALAAALFVPSATEAAPLSVTVPPGFTDTTVFSGLTQPTAVRFSPDGRVFVAEKSGIIKVFDSLTDTTPTVFADLRTNVYNYWDRGLLGLALDPNFPTNPYVYVLYAYDHQLGSSSPPPYWGTPGQTSDPCPTPPGPTTDGCVVSGRLSRLTASGDVMTGSEKVLVEDWCQQYPSHSIGDLAFGPDGYLYASAGEGASFDFVDYGQKGTPLNPCGDPPGGVGATLTPPTAEGGALRAQSLQRATSEPISLDGSIIRVDPATGDAPSSNPLYGSPNVNARRIIAYGLRNPFRFAFRPGTSEIWAGDVGQTTWEEIDRIPNPTASPVSNFGWPCYEGPSPQPGFQAAGLNICTNLYNNPSSVSSPYFSYNHSDQIVPGESCTTGSSSISGLDFAFTTGSSPYPSEYDSALFFADYSRNCIWVMEKGPDGKPSPGLIKNFVQGAPSPVDLQRGPNGYLYYVDFNGGTVHRIDYNATGVPQNTSPPSVSGLAQQGQTLTVNAGSWSGTQPITLSEQWRRCDSSGANCADISGATGSSYTLTSGDVGSTIRVRETATNGAGSNYADSAQTALVGSGSGGGSYSSTVLADNPVLYWRLGDASGGFADSSGHGNDGTGEGSGLSRHVSDLLPADSDGALTFTDATSDVIRSSVSALPSSRVTAEVWFKANSFANYIDLLSHASDGTGWGYSLVVTASGILTWGVFTQTNDYLVSYGPLSTGTTYHLVGTYDGNTVSLYVNGVLVGSRTPGALPLSTTSSIWTGKVDTTAGVTADELAIYPTALSATRVQAHYNAGTSMGTNHPPVPVIDTPSPSLTWVVGQEIGFHGSATDAEDGTIPDSGLSWQLIIHHCPSNCHLHYIQSWAGVSSGSFNAPDHEYPSWLELMLTATDSQGAQASTSVLLYPVTVDLNFASNPSGLTLAVDTGTGTTPFMKTVIQGSANTVSAPNQQLGGTNYAFSSWSDGGAQTHNITASAAATYTATFTADPSNTTPPSISGTAQQGQTLSVTAGSWTGTQPITLSEQWRRCDSSGANCTDISGATGASYALGSADVGSTIRVREAATNSQGSSYAEAAQTAVVTSGAAQPPQNVTPPAVLGSTRQGQTLTVTTGSWTGTQPITLSEQWRRCDSSGANCTDISGATGTSYTLGSADVGSTIRVRETATNDGGSGFVDSAQTAVVTASYSATVLADSPVLYWRLGEASGTFADSSGSGNSGTAEGTGLSRHVADLVPSDTDGALTFTDAVSDVTRSSVTGLSSSMVTVELWFKANAFANNIDLESHAYSGSAWGYSLVVNSKGSLSWGIFTQGHDKLITYGLSTGTLYHIVGTYDGTAVRLYVNGSLVRSRTAATVSLATGTSVWSGQVDTTAGVTVDELAVYPAALSGTRILAHYNAR